MSYSHRPATASGSAPRAASRTRPTTAPAHAPRAQFDVTALQEMRSELLPLNVPLTGLLARPWRLPPTQLNLPLAIPPRQIRTLSYRLTPAARAVQAARREQVGWALVKARCEDRAVRREVRARDKQKRSMKRYVTRQAIQVDGKERFAADKERNYHKAAGRLSQWSVRLCRDARAKILAGAQNGLASVEAVGDMVTEAFDKFDFDGDGSLDRDELRAGLMYFRVAALSEKQLDAVFEVMDTDRSGGIDVQEFRTWLNSGEAALAKAAACAAVGRKMSIYAGRDG